MAEPLTVSVKVHKLGELVYEITGVMKCRFYKQLYIGYKRKDALKEFQKYLESKL